MRINRTFRIGFALLLALMLPLQGYAAMPGCGRLDGQDSSAQGVAASLSAQMPMAPMPMDHAHMTHAHMAQTHCARVPAAAHHHCGSCCCVAAIALAPAHWMVPFLTAPEISIAVLGSPPAGTLDHLDRPPRPIPA